MQPGRFVHQGWCFLLACSRFGFFLWQTSTEKAYLGEEPGRTMWVSELIFPKKKRFIIFSQPSQVSGTLSS